MTTRRRPSKRTFGEIWRMPNGRYRVRYTGPDGARYSAGKTFVTKMDAEAWLAGQDRLISRDEWRPPTRAPKKEAPGQFEPYARTAIAARRLRPSTRVLYERLLRLEILPRFGDMAIADITRDDVTRWHASMAATPTQQANAYGLLKSILREAVEDELIERNPARVRGGTGKRAAREVEVLTPEQLTRYLAAIPGDRRIALMLAGWCGLRTGEVRGLRERDLDLARGIVHVRQGIVRLPNQLVIGPPKTDAGIRDVVIPPHLLPELTAWRDKRPARDRDALLFTAREGTSPMNDTTLREAHYRGRLAIGTLDLTIHDLRHTGATLAAQQGATIAELQARIGHTTPEMAMRYQHTAATRDADLAARISAAAIGDPVSPGSGNTQPSGGNHGQPPLFDA